MEMRALGRSNLQVAPLILGCNVFRWTADEPTSHAILDAFVDGGFNCIDTADVYAIWTPAGGGASEEVIGSWLAKGGRRDRVVIASKFGAPMGEGKSGLSRRYMMEAVEASLKRMGTDYIDLYQSHRDDPATPQEETAEAYAELIRQGKVRVIGASNFDAGRLKSAIDAAGKVGAPRYETLQPQYNLYDRSSFEGPLQDACVAEQVSAIPYYGLASGFLTGKYRSAADLGQSARGERSVARYLDERGLRILGALDAVSKAHGVKPAQVALAWVMAQPGVAGPIASATSVAQLKELMGAAALKLSADDLKALDAASAPAPAAA